MLLTTSCDPVASKYPEVNIDPESGNTVLTWCKRWEEAFRIEFGKQDDAWKTQ